MADDNQLQEQQEQVKSRVITIRDIPVIIDRDVAEIYGVTTREVNQLLKNNPKKFPEGYVIELTEKEKSEVVISNDHLKRLKYSHAAVKAYTERGLYMLATLIKSDIATDATIAIIDTFTNLRKVARMIDAANHGEKHSSRTIQQLLTETFTNNLPITMRKTTFEANLGVFKVKVETTRSKEEKP